MSLTGFLGFHHCSNLRFDLELLWISIAEISLKYEKGTILLRFLLCHLSSFGSHDDQQTNQTYMLIFTEQH